jgi:hypothetical protein
MRACFLGQNICALGFGTATLQAPPLVMDKPMANQNVTSHGFGAPAGADVANPQRPDPATPRARMSVM